MRTKAVYPIVDGDGSADVSLTESAPYPNIITARLRLENGKDIVLTDYASAGKIWNNGKKMAVWLLTE